MPYSPIPTRVARGNGRCLRRVAVNTTTHNAADRQYDQREPAIARPNGKDKAMFAHNEPVPMYQVLIYSIAAHLWRWEIRSAGGLLRCGTARTKTAAEGEARDVLSA